MYLKPKPKRATSIILAVIAATICGAPAFSENFMQQGIKEYTAGDYNNAAGHLGAALSTDFNNATLHYYLGNTYLRLKENPDAIREFRIAYALQPTGNVGSYSKKALGLLGVDVSDDAAKVDAKPGSAAAAAPPPPPDNRDRAASAIKEQADREKALRDASAQSGADALAKQNADALKRAKDDMLNNTPHYYSRRYGTPYPVNLSSDDQKRLDSMKEQLESQQKSYVDPHTQQAKEIQKSYENLQNLLNEKAKAGDAKLSPNGTNLYIRNYEPTVPTTKNTK